MFFFSEEKGKIQYSVISEKKYFDLSRNIE